VANLKKAIKSKKTSGSEAARSEFHRNFNKMEKKLALSYNKLKNDMLKKSSLITLKKDSHNLLLLLGEVRYLENECKRLRRKAK
jgi:hypothetical protein